VGLVAVANVLFCGLGSIAGMDTASTNVLSRADEQAVVALERMGRYEEAEARCIQLLQQNPNDAAAQRLLAEVQDGKHTPNPRADLMGLLDVIIIPEVNVQGGRVADVIDFLQTESQKISGAERPINFVWQAPENLKTAKVTLNLRRVPLAFALKYVTELAGLRYRVDPYAVVIYQPASAAPAAPAASKP
jgi:hypothetical protein